MNNKKLLLSVLFIGILCISVVSASWWNPLDWFNDEKIISTYEDNIKAYNSKNKELVIKDLFEEDKVKIKLLTPLNYQVSRGYKKVAEYEVHSKKSLKLLVSKMELYNITDFNSRQSLNEQSSSKIDRQIDFKIKTIQQVSIDDYETICKEIYNETTQNITEVCVSEISGSHLEDRETWLPLDKVNFLKNEKIIVGLFTDVQAGDYIEWIPTFQIDDGDEIRVEEWAIWEETEAHGLALTAGNQAQTILFGFKVTIGDEAVKLVSVTKLSACTGATATLFNTSSENLGDATFSGDVATFATPLDMDASTVYYIVVGSGGASYQRYYGATGLLPVAGTYLNWTDGGTYTAGAVGPDSRPNNIVSINISGGEENTAPTITANITKPDAVNQNTDYLVNLTIEDLDVGDTLTGYVQFYVNSTLTSTEQSAVAVNGTTTLIGTLSYGNFSAGDNLTAQVWAGDGTANTTKVYLVSSIVISPPSVTNLIEFPTDPATYSLGTIYHFNATVTDNGILDDIFFEFDGTNYTATNISADIFNVSTTNLAAGVYNYRWFANDSLGNINNTATGSYTIDKAISQTSLTFSLDSPQTYGTAITPTCSVITGDGPAVLEMDGNVITSGVAITLGADTYSFNCSYTENANYTGSQNVSSYTIDKGIPTASLTSNLGWYIDRGEEVTIGSSDPQSNDGDVLYEVFRDSVSKGAGEIWTPSAGTYTYFLNTTGGANWTANASMHTVALIVDPSNPNITALTEYPSDPANYSQETIYQFNATIIDANTLDTILFEFNGVNYSTSNAGNIFNVSFTNLTAGNYNYRWFANDTFGNMNNSVTGDYTINKAIPSLTLSATTPITYGTITNFSGGGCPAQLNCSLDIANNVYAAGTKTGNYSTAGNINYTSAYANFTVTINKASLTGTITGVSVINYTNAANITANETNNNDSDVTYILYRNNATVSNSDNTVLGVGTYYYHYNSTGGENYTSNISIDTFTLTIDKATAEVYAYISNSRANYAGTNLTAKNEYLNGSLNIGLGNINMYLNDSLIASGTSPLYNITDFPLGSYYFNVTYDGNDNYTSDEEHWSINISIWFLANLTGIFNLNADTGTTAYDISGNLNNGTISGATWGSDDIDVTLTDAVDYFINKNTGLFVLLNDARDKTLFSITFTYYEYADDFLGEIIIKILPGLLIMLVLIMIFRLFTSRRDDGGEERVYEY